MAEDLFEKLRASKPLNVPEAKEKYDSVGVVLIGLRSTGGEAFEHLRDGALKTGGQAARRAGMGAKAPLTLAKNFRPGPDLVLGIAFDAMKQSNNSVTKATGLVFDTALAGLTFRMLVGANPVGAAAILAFELYNTAETILKWMEEREQQKLAKEYDLILHHSVSVSLQNRRTMQKADEEFQARIKNPSGFWMALSDHILKTYQKGSSNKQWSAEETRSFAKIYALVRQLAINSILDLAHKAFQYEQLAELLMLFFQQAYSRVDDNVFLGAPPKYTGKIEWESRSKLFGGYYGEFLALRSTFKRHRQDLENLSKIFAWLSPDDLLGMTT